MNCNDFFTSFVDIERLQHLLLYTPKSPLIFTSGLFLFLFVAFTLIYTSLKHHDTLRILFVTAFSYYFYYKSSGLHFAILALVTLTDWLLARTIYRCQTSDGSHDADITCRRGMQTMLLCVSLLIDLGMLAYFKYTNFLLECFAWATSTEAITFDILLPVGISFFTFQSLSYTIDVYRGQLRPLDRLMDYAFYVSFFPQLVAGPIVRARDFIPQIRRQVFVSDDMLGRGVFLIVAGLFKKAVISDYISVNFVERVFDNPTLYAGIENLLAVYGYTIQIYCDFSGYSDMAIGIALLLGFHFPDNFRAPYTSGSVAEFWHRWHISLSTWLKDYLYISLGGNRRGKVRTYINLVLTMLIGGLWHGASLNFIVWGGLHGVALAVNRAYRQFLGRGRDYRGNLFMRILGIVVTFHFVAFAWIFFRSSSFEVTQQMLSQIVFYFHPELLGHVIHDYAPSMFLILLGYILHYMPTSVSDLFRNFLTCSPLIVKAAVVCAVAYMIVQVKSSDIQPFIYFQF